MGPEVSVPISGEITSDQRHEYTEALRDHLQAPDEAALERASGIGHQAVARGTSLLGIAALHHEALREVLRGPSAPTDHAMARQRGMEFFMKCLGPFEASHGDQRDVIAALWRMNDGIEKEARRIAHALHEEAGGLLASIHLALEQFAWELSPRGGVRISRIRELLEQIERQLRELSRDLRPAMLDDLGLIPALVFLAKRVSQKTDLSIIVEGATGGRLPPAIETTLYRNVQEALGNVVEHHGAAQATVRVTKEPGAIHCSVRDEGAGLGDGEPGLALAGIRERLDHLRGTLQVITGPGQGTELLMLIPLADRS